MKHLTLIITILILIYSTGCNNQDSIEVDYFNFNTSNYYFKGELNGKLTYFEERLSSISNGGGKLIPSDSTDLILTRYDCRIISDKMFNGNNSSVELKFYNLFQYSVLNLHKFTPDSIFRDIFSIGNRNFISNNSYEQNHESGVLIIWTDNTGTKWASAKNVDNITGNELIINQNRTFEITNSIYQDPSPQITVNLHKIRGTFDCVLYNIGGDSIMISNGEFVGIYINQYE